MDIQGKYIRWNPGSFYYSALPSLVFGFQSQDIFMVPNGSWSLEYYIPIPGKEQEKGEGVGVHSSSLYPAKGIFPRSATQKFLPIFFRHL